MSRIIFIDSHTHAQSEQFDLDRDEVIKRSLDNGVGMINAGADLESSRKAIELAEKYNSAIWATVGIHPTEQINPDLSAIKEIEGLAENKKVVGIGECGLDYFRLKKEEDKIFQKNLFEEHIKISNRVKKPLVIHCREAFVDVISILKSNKGNLLENPGILHFFTGNLDDAEKLLDLNFSFTFGGLVTFNRDFDEIIRYIPSDRILIETDAPFVAPKSHRGQRNEPLYIKEVLSAISQIKGVNEDEFGEIVLANSKKVFGLDLST